MDTWHVFRSNPSFRPAAELSTDTAPIDLVELVRVRYNVRWGKAQGLGAVVSTFVVIAVLAVIAVFAIATSTGWSVLDPWSG